MKDDSTRANDGPITSISYKLEKDKQATTNITRKNEDKNFEVYPNFTLRKLGFTGWIEVHDLARKMKGKVVSQLLENPSKKFKWVRDTAKKLNIPLPPKSN